MNPEDDVFQSARKSIPTRVRGWMRDSGVIRVIMDSLVWFGVPTFVSTYPWAVLDFLRLGGREDGALFWLAKTLRLNDTRRPGLDGLREDLKVHTEKISYGADERQYVHLITITNPEANLPPSSNYGTIR